LSTKRQINPDLAGCARCTIETSERLCQKEDGIAPPFCPTKNLEQVIEKAFAKLLEPENLAFARAASIQEGEGYADRDLGYERTRPVKPRVLETLEFARKMSYTRLGLAFCMGLAVEARVFEKLARSWGFEVVSAMCKVGRKPKELIGLGDDEKVRIGCYEPMCNSIAQAEVLNSQSTEFNVVIGLCVGHDSLFLKHAEAPCTILAAKDRVLGHNPLAALYTIDSYYQALKP
jgi:uncharacterized metal-binding protein